MHGNRERIIGNRHFHKRDVELFRLLQLFAGDWAGGSRDVELPTEKFSHARRGDREGDIHIHFRVPVFFKLIDSNF